MARYYTKEILKTRVKILEELMGEPLKLISCNGEYAINRENHKDEPFSWAGWYRPVKELIIYVDGIIAGIKYIKH